MSDIEQISIYKFKNSVTSFESCVKKDNRGNPIVSLLQYAPIQAEGIDGKFWYFDGAGNEKNALNIPWLSFMNEALETPIALEYANRYPRGLFLYKIENEGAFNFFAMTFGLGGDANIDKNKILYDFGIKVAMNICNPNEIKSIQTSQHESISIQSEKQILTGAGLSVFNIDYNDEFFKRIIGKAKTAYNFISSVTGGEKIQLKFDKDNKLSWANILDRTKVLDDLYHDDSYKNTEFKSFDNWSFEKDAEKIDELNTKLVVAINSRNFDKISLSSPEFVDLDTCAFTYQNNEDAEKEDLNISDFLETITRGDVTISTLKNRGILLVNKITETKFPKWKVYQCIVAEILDDEDNCYILFNGQWRKISTNFRNSVQQYFSDNNIEFDTQLLQDDIPNDIDIYDTQANQNREDIFNKQVVSNRENLFLFDKSKIEIASEKKYEICDILSSDSDLIHVKKYKSGASSLSHLFSQVKIYSEAFIIDKNTRNTMIDFFDTDSLNSESKNFEKDVAQFKALLSKSGRLHENDFKVVLCILTADNIQITDLPFMTQYEISKTDEYLRKNRGFNVKYINRKVIMH